ncbi:hypothetical protein ACFO3J_24960 [Streptomyces polygonati]|uniref:Uncharacterized protein n=1 Tax=Streptomyces polygonati TaxID=1617087 RepID=A0ABV8HWV7_9ACTN
MASTSQEVAEPTVYAYSLYLAAVTAVVLTVASLAIVIVKTLRKHPARVAAVMLAGGTLLASVPPVIGLIAPPPQHTGRPAGQSPPGPGLCGKAIGALARASAGPVRGRT